MKIYLISVCYNEKKLAPFFLKHYSPICDKIIIYDNMSTDGTPEILSKDNKVEIIQFDTDGQFNDQKHMEIKNTCWKPYKNECDWMICIDFDEFLYHPDMFNLLSDLKSKIITVPSVLGFQMFHKDFDFNTNHEQIYKVVNTGYYDHMFSKRVIFDPSKVTDMRYTIGSHNCKPGGIVNDSKDSERQTLFLLHFKHLGIAYEKYKIENDYKPRIDKNPGAKGWYKMHLSNLTKPYSERFSKKGPIVNLIKQINENKLFIQNPKLKNRSGRLLASPNINTPFKTNPLNHSKIFRSRFKMNINTNNGNVNK